MFKSLISGQAVFPFHPAVCRMASSEHCLVRGITAEPRTEVEYSLSVYVAETRRILLFLPSEKRAINNGLTCES